jgi:hypothetical protein
MEANAEVDPLTMFKSGEVSAGQFSVQGAAGVGRMVGIEGVCSYTVTDGVAPTGCCAAGVASGIGVPCEGGVYGGGLGSC